MRSSRAIGNTPYAVVVRYMPMSTPAEDHVVHYRRSLRAALEECRLVTRTWLQLVGGQFPVLAWFVIDSRDGTEHHPTQMSRGRTQRGITKDGPGGLF